MADVRRAGSPSKIENRTSNIEARSVLLDGERSEPGIRP
jgi:hypothetical protein